MNVLRFVTVEEICRRGNVRDTDVTTLRRALDRDVRRTTHDADALFRIHDCCRVRDPAWAEFFIETVTDFIVRETEPSGYLTSEQGAWLIGHLAPSGRIETKTELDLLLNVIDKARWAPESLVRFALEQIRAAVVSGKGPLRCGTRLEPGSIIAAEVEWLREIFFTFGGEGNVPITRTEGELLFAIDAAIVDPRKCQAWVELFAQAGANAILSASGYGIASREEALRRSRLLRDREPDVEVLAALLSSGPDGVLGRYRPLSTDEAALAKLERQRIGIITQERVSACEFEWLTGLLRGGNKSMVESALIAFIGRERAKMHPELQKLLEHPLRAA